MKRHIVLTLLVTFVVVVAAGLIVIFSGWYNVSAAEKEGGFAEWLFSTTRTHSVRAHAEEIHVADLNDPKIVSLGFEHFNRMCTACHGSPIRNQAEIAKGLNPRPPRLTHAAERWSTSELFWIIKNGIAMTGMPAWGPTHPDSILWGIVAVVQRLPSMSPEEYRAAIPSGGTAHEEMEEEYEHEHAHEGHEHGEPAHDEHAR